MPVLTIDRRELRLARIELGLVDPGLVILLERLKRRPVRNTGRTRRRDPAQS
jgi:hypothetical protein